MPLRNLKTVLNRVKCLSGSLRKKEKTGLNASQDPSEKDIQHPRENGGVSDCFTLFCRKSENLRKAPFSQVDLMIEDIVVLFPKVNRMFEPLFPTSVSQECPRTSPFDKNVKNCRNSPLGRENSSRTVRNSSMSFRKCRKSEEMTDILDVGEVGKSLKTPSEDPPGHPRC